MQISRGGAVDSDSRNCHWPGSICAKTATVGAVAGAAATVMLAQKTMPSIAGAAQRPDRIEYPSNPIESFMPDSIQAPQRYLLTDQQGCKDG